MKIFKNTGTFETDKMHIHASLRKDTYYFYAIESVTDYIDSTCYDSYYFQCSEKDLPSALAEYLDFLKNSQQPLFKLTDFYFQGERVLTLPPTSGT